MNVGDASIQFVADTSGLDAAFQHVEEGAAAALAPVQENVAAVGAAFDSMAENARAAGAAMGAAAEEGVQAAGALSDAQINVAKLTYENQIAQKALSISLRQVRATGGDVASVIQSLAQAQARAAQTAQALAAAQMEVKVASGEMATAAVEAGAETEVSMFEAKAEIALLGEEIGVKIPRHLRGFMAQLPGVGALLNSAFAATAVFMLIQIFPELVEKIGDAASAMGGWDEKAKKAYDDLLDGNRKLIVEMISRAQAQREIGDIGLSSEEKYAAALANTKAHIGDVAQANANFLRQQERNQEELKSLTTGWALWKGIVWNTIDGTSDRVKELNTALAAEGPIIEQLTAQLTKMREEDLKRQEKEQSQAKVNQAKQEAAALAQQQTATDEAKLAAAKKTSQAEADLWAATGKLLLAQGYINATQELQMQRDAEDAKYASELNFQQKMLALLQKDPSKNRAAIIAKNAEIEALENEHEAKILEAKAKAIALQEAMSKRQVETEQKELTALVEVPPALKAQITAIEQLEASYRTLGMTGTTMFDSLAVTARESYQKVAAAGKAGMASQLDVMVAYSHALQAQIDADKQAGKSTDVLTKAYKDNQAALDRLTGATQKYDKAEHSVAGEMGELRKKLDEQRIGVTQNQTAFTALAGDMSNVMGQAVQSVVSGQESIGQALEKGLEAYLAQLAGKAAADALYCVAEGFAMGSNPYTAWMAPLYFHAAEEYGLVAALAGVGAVGMGAAAGGSSGSGGGGSSSSSATPASGNGISGSAGTAGSNPGQGVNVQRFATGGLISQPTLAMIGDSINSSSQGAREGVLPLDDPAAMGAIADAIAGRMQVNGGGGDSHFHFPNLKGIVSPDVLDTVIDQVNTRVNGGKRLLASEARRTVRRS